MENQDNASDVDRVIDVVCGYFKVTREEMLSKTRKRPFVTARAMCQYYLIKETKLTLHAIAQLIYKSDDHTNVIYHRDAIDEQITAKHHNEFKIHVENLNKLLNIN